MTPVPGTKEAISLQQGVRAGRIRPGDLFLFRNGEHGPLNAGIRYVQRRALLDLNPQADPARVAAAAEFTHAAMAINVEQPNLVGVSVIAEQYAPHARFRTFEELDKGGIVLVKRLLGAARRPVELDMAIAAMNRLAVDKDPYPLSELLYFWFRWGSKISFNRKFADTFRDNLHDVCSSAIVRACRPGWFNNSEWAEAYYPARLAIDSEYTEEVGVFST